MRCSLDRPGSSFRTSNAVPLTNPSSFLRSAIASLRRSWDRLGCFPSACKATTLDTRSSWLKSATATARQSSGRLGCAAKTNKAAILTRRLLSRRDAATSLRRSSDRLEVGRACKTFKATSLVRASGSLRYDTTIVSRRSLDRLGCSLKLRKTLCLIFPSSPSSKGEVSGSSSSSSAMKMAWRRSLEKFRCALKAFKAARLTLGFSFPQRTSATTASRFSLDRLVCFSKTSQAKYRVRWSSSLQASANTASRWVSDRLCCVFKTFKAACLTEECLSLRSVATTVPTRLLARLGSPK